MIHYSVLKYIQAQIQPPWSIRLCSDGNVSEALITTPATVRAREVLGACERWRGSEYEIRIQLRSRLEILHNIINTSTPYGQRLYFDLADPNTVGILDDLLLDIGKLNDSRNSS